MTSSLWRALEHLGAEGAAACDWQRHLGDDWEICRAFLKPVPGHAETVLDPERPARRLDVVTDGEDRFLGIVADDAPDGPPLPLSANDVAPLTLEWQAVADALGKILGFTANRYESHGLTRQIGTAQNGSDPVRPVILCLPAGHFGDHGRMLRDISARHDATILLPSAPWVTPPLQAVASANRLSMVGLAEECGRSARRRSGEVPNLAAPVASPAARKKIKPVLRIQPGWRWDMVRIVVAYGGRLQISCGGQHGEHVLPKTTAKKPNQALGILMKLAVDQEWSNPHSGAGNHESVRKNFQRLEKLLCALVPLPGKPFHRESLKFVPVFQASLHPDLEAEFSRQTSRRRDPYSVK